MSNYLPAHFVERPWGSEKEVSFCDISSKPASSDLAFFELSFAGQNQDDLNFLRFGHDHPFLNGRKVDGFDLQIFPGAADTRGHDLEVSTAVSGRSRSDSGSFAYYHA